MNLNFVIDKNLDEPIYRQLMVQLKDKIENGIIKNGEQLPTEREVSRSSGISRGTIKKVYDELVRQGMLSAVQGRGTFVTWSKDHEKDDVCHYIQDSIVHMKSLGFSYGEMNALLDVLLEKEYHSGIVHIASIDCNPETLDIFASQISDHHNVRFYPFLLNEIQGFVNGADIFKNFDLVFSTTTHYEELSILLENQTDKIIKAAVSPDMATIVGLAGIKSDMNVGILAKSARFAQIIHNNIKKTTHLKSEPQYYVLTDQARAEGLERFLKESQVIVTPPFYTLQLSRRQEGLLLDHCAGGGRFVTFHYAIERGSLIHISDRISRILQQ